MYMIILNASVPLCFGKPWAYVIYEIPANFYVKPNLKTSLI